MKAISMFRGWLRARRTAASLLKDCRGIAAIEFAIIVPVMLVIFFGVVEISSGVAVDRKVTLVARTLSDLTSQSNPDGPTLPMATIDDNFLQNVFTASIAILQPYSPTPTNATLSEIYIDSSHRATVRWSRAATIASGATQATLATSTHSPGDIITAPLLPPQLVSATAATQNYMILSEVSYLYTPAVGYVMGRAGVTLNDVSYTRPRQVVCVILNSPANSPAGPLPNPNPIPCPTPP